MLLYPDNLRKNTVQRFNLLLEGRYAAFQFVEAIQIRRKAFPVKGIRQIAPQRLDLLLETRCQNTCRLQAVLKFIQLLNLFRIDLHGSFRPQGSGNIFQIAVLGDEGVQLSQCLSSLVLLLCTYLTCGSTQCLQRLSDFRNLLFNLRQMPSVHQGLRG